MVLDAMRASAVVAVAVAGMVFAFAAGWLASDYRSERRISRMMETRDLYRQMAQDALDMSAKAMEHSLSSAETLEICLGKLGLKPAKAEFTAGATP